MRANRGMVSIALVGLMAGVASACGGPRRPPVLNPEDQVSIGYARVDREDVTGSISSLTSKDLELLRVTRIEELIRDRIPGVHVIRRANGDYSFRIRGARSLVGSNEPLVVIDGMAVSAASMSAALAGMSPNDVTRIDVLKDAGSTAAYGVRGANGVILITTRATRGY